MEPTPTPATETPATPPAVPPTQPVTNGTPASPQPASELHAAETVVTAPAQTPEELAEAKSNAIPIEPPAAKQPKAPKKPRGATVTTAIIATVVIVLGLSLLAVVAFISGK